MTNVDLEKMTHHSGTEQGMNTHQLAGPNLELLNGPLAEIPTITERSGMFDPTNFQ